MSEYPIARAMYRRTVSDGHYGTVTAEIGLEMAVKVLPDDGVFEILDAAETLLGSARDMVHAELAQSTSEVVRRAVAAPKRTPPVVPVVDADDEELPY